MPFDSTSTSADIAAYAERIPTPGEQHQAAVAAARGRFGTLRSAEPRRCFRNPGLIRRCLFWGALVVGTGGFAFHMSDALARAQADIRIIQSMELVK